MLVSLIRHVRENKIYTWLVGEGNAYKTVLTCSAEVYGTGDGCAAYRVADVVKQAGYGGDFVVLEGAHVAGRSGEFGGDGC